MDTTKVQSKETFIERLLSILPVVLAFLMPVFFLPITSEFYEFNKLVLLTISTIFMMLVWSLKMLFNKKVYIAKSELDLPLILFTAVFIAAAVFSLDKTSSIYGKYGRWYPSVMGVLTMISFYYVVASNITSKKLIRTTLFAFITGTTVSTVVALLRYFGITLGSAPYLQTPNFTLTGSATTAAIIAAVAAVVSLVFLTYEKAVPVKILMVQTAAINFVGVALINVIPGWGVLATGLVGFLLFVPVAKAMESKQHLTALLGVGVAIVLALLLPTSKELIANTSYPKEVTLGARDSWIISLSTVRDFPVLGSGPSTFYLNFPRYRPISLNNTDLWNVRFDKPYNEIFGTVGSLGLVGLLATIFFLYKTLRFQFTHKGFEDNTGVTAALNVGLLAVLSTYLFTYSTVMSGFLMFLFLALLVADTAMDVRSNKAEVVILSLSSFSSMSIIGSLNEGDKKEILPYIVTFPMMVALVVGSYFTYRVYASEYYTRAAITALTQNNGSLTYELQAKAIKINPRRDVYHNAYVQTNLALANSLAANENLTDTEKATIQTLIAQAIRETRTTTEVLNPLNVGGWETRAQVYRALIGIAQDADTWAVRSYTTAVQLDPTNPRLRVDLGGIYYLQGDYLAAANLFREATRLKADYANGYYNLANALVQLNAPQDAVRQLQVVQRLVPAESEDYKKVTAEIDSLLANPTVAGAAETRPTVEELAEQGLPEEEKTEPANQQPLTNPEEVQVIEPQAIQGEENINLNEQGGISKGKEEVQPETQPQEEPQEQSAPIEVINESN